MNKLEFSSLIDIFVSISERGVKSASEGNSEKVLDFVPITSENTPSVFSVIFVERNTVVAFSYTGKIYPHTEVTQSVASYYFAQFLSSVVGWDCRMRMWETAD